MKNGCITVLKGKRHGKLYFLQGNSHIGEVNAVTTVDVTHLWHSRLGHVSQKELETLVKKAYLDSGKVSSL